jgi:hypothetical protein
LSYGNQVDGRHPESGQISALRARNGPQTGIGSPNVNAVAVWQEPPPEPRVASVHLAFDRLSDPATRQLPAFEARAGRWEELRWSLERIRHRFGANRLWRATAERPTAALPEHRSRLVGLNE